MLVESLKRSWKDLALFWTQTVWLRAQSLSSWVGHAISEVCKVPITVLLFEAVKPTNKQKTKTSLHLLAVFGILKTSIAEELRLQDLQLVLLSCCCVLACPSRSVVLVGCVFSGLTWKLVTCPATPEPALGGVTRPSGHSLLSHGPFPLPWTYVVISDGVLGKKCFFFFFSHDLLQ